MANPYQAGQALGSALFGSTRDTYDGELDRRYKIEQNLQQARLTRSKAVLGEQNVAQRQVIDDPALLGQVLGGDVDARNRYMTAVMLSNENVNPDVLGSLQKTIMTQAGHDKAVLGDYDGANRHLFATGGAKQLTRIDEQNLIPNQFVTGGGGVTTTDQGQANIRRNDASAANSYASAQNSLASAGRTRQATTIDAAKFEAQKARGTLGDSGASNKPVPVGALKELLAVEEALGATTVLNDIIGKNAKRLEEGTLRVGPVDTFGANMRTRLNKSTPEDVARKEWQADLTKIVNESLRLNKGVQTEGDAVRAADELMAASDQKTVAAALARLAGFNRRAVELHTRKQSLINQNYGRGPALGDPAAQTPTLGDAAPGGGVDDLLGKYGVR